MATRKRYPKSFYDDGLGDILDWIDDEVLVHSREKEPSKDGPKSKKTSKRSSDSGDVKKANKSNETRPKKQKLYGDNDLEKVVGTKTIRLANLDAPKEEYELHTNDEELRKVDKTIESRTRGLINRLAAQTMPYVTGEFKKLYSTNSRNDLNNALFNNVESSLLSKSSVAKRKLVAEMMLLISYLDSTISHRTGASIEKRQSRPHVSTDCHVLRAMQNSQQGLKL